MSAKKRVDFEGVNVFKYFQVKETILKLVLLNWIRKKNLFLNRFD